MIPEGNPPRGVKVISCAELLRLAAEGLRARRGAGEAAAAGVVPVGRGQAAEVLL